MRTTLQGTVYFWDDIERLLFSIEAGYILSKGGKEDPTDGFMDFINLFKNYFSKDIKHHYYFEHVKRYAENLRNLLGNKCNEQAFQAVANVFDFYGREGY